MGTQVKVTYLGDDLRKQKKEGQKNEKKTIKYALKIQAAGVLFYWRAPMKLWGSYVRIVPPIDQGTKALTTNPYPPSFEGCSWHCPLSHISRLHLLPIKQMSLLPEKVPRKRSREIWAFKLGNYLQQLQVNTEVNLRIWVDDLYSFCPAASSCNITYTLEMPKDSLSHTLSPLQELVHSISSIRKSSTLTSFSTAPNITLGQHARKNDLFFPEFIDHLFMIVFQNFRHKLISIT